MIDRPFDQIRDIFRENNKRNKELLKDVFEKSDSISLWIIGLSIGGISIFANDIGKAKSAISPELLHPILYSLAVSVIAGLIYRGLYLYLFVVLNQTSDGIDIAFSRQKTMDTESCLTGNETFEEVLVLMYNGTGENFNSLLPNYNDSDNDKKKVLYDSLVRHYLASVEFAKRDTELALDFIAETYSNFTGVSKERYKREMQVNNLGKKFKLILRMTSFFAAISPRLMN